MENEEKGGFFTGRGKIAGILVLMLFIGGGACLVWRCLEAERYREEQERLAQLATEAVTELVIETEAETEEETEPETEAPYVSPIDFEALWEENPDTVGWIRIPDTVVDYPIVHDAEDNERYLHVDFYGEHSVYGTIYLDCDSEPDFSGWNNPIYGHHMKDGSMFKALEYFKDEDYFKAHRYFEIYTPERTIHLKTIACYYGSADGITRKTKFDSQEEFDQWLEARLAPCPFAEIPEDSVDSVFVLVTCSYEMKNARTFLFAVETDEVSDIR